MQVHNVSIDKKYFEPIINNQITLLIFKQHILPGAEIGDYITSSSGAYEIEARIIDTYVKAFRNITEEEVKKTGFLTKDFLQEELISLYDIKTSWDLSKGLLSTIDSELFFFVEISTEEERKEKKLEYFYNNTATVDLYRQNYGGIYNGKEV